ncbi:Flp pilus assembly protein TadB [Bacillus mesophilus]|uniref:YxlC family protein n=1 Tax=Bacillus mesophilus TaxID=1808955 RepID=A0A6M0Q662_9BACI|nr:Flp pilus assembly protein TadB [Bacillus mesophilus]NEY70990.1 YxlC family protein [Bacillus mesophilus]
MNKNHPNHRESILDQEDEQTVKVLKDGLDKIDQYNPVITPNIQWFQEQVELEKTRIRKKQWKDLLVFISVALLLLVIVIAVVYRQPVLFLYFQLIGIILLPLAFNKKRKKVSSE